MKEMIIEPRKAHTMEEAREILEQQANDMEDRLKNYVPSEHGDPF